MDTFHHVLSGESNLLTAFLRGDARMRGDLVSARMIYVFLRHTRRSGGHP